LVVSKDHAMAVSHLRNTPITGKSYTTPVDAAPDSRAVQLSEASVSSTGQPDVSVRRSDSRDRVVLGRPSRGGGSWGAVWSAHDQRIG
ncbi:hypothetical protein, partial [Micromonospora globbae]|uniref:hypothetical protein n=1 Tax=Micromonospora globbae TaxID=1894969 RepID=UPI003412DCE9